MKMIFCLIVLLSFTKLYANTDAIAVYHRHINQAEYALCLSDFDEALAHYDSAYSVLKNRMSSRSLYNYFVLSFDLKKPLKCRTTLKELKRRGWALPAFTSHFSKYYSYESLQELTSLYSSIIKVPQTMDLEYAAKIDSLVTIDQVTDSVLREKNGGLLDQFAKDSFFNLARHNISILKEWFKVKFPADYIVPRGEQPFDLLRYQVILYHNAQNPSNESHELDDVLFQAVKNGDLDPVDFDYYLSFHNSALGTDTTLIIDGNKLKVPTNPYYFASINRLLYQWPEDTAKISSYNLQRQKIPGLYPSEGLRMRLIFQYQNPKFKLSTQGYITNIDLELPERIMSKLILIPKL